MVQLGIHIYIKDVLKGLLLYFTFSQIWLNLHVNHHQFGYITKWIPKNTASHFVHQGRESGKSYMLDIQKWPMYPAMARHGIENQLGLHVAGHYPWHSTFFFSLLSCSHLVFNIFLNYFFVNFKFNLYYIKHYIHDE